ncbi:hypothetical protein LJB82_04080, partial [Desulfovibrio sp. OttesenSCG-928-M16]|nr:hypothetical protein [Desulfovibrio sp. OttesenSCG-928-M16]
KIHSDYQFYVPPFFDSYGEVEKQFSDAQTELFRKYRQNVNDDSSVLDNLIQTMYVELQSSME